MNAQMRKPKIISPRKLKLKTVIKRHLDFNQKSRRNFNTSRSKNNSGSPERQDSVAST